VKALLDQDPARERHADAAAIRESIAHAGHGRRPAGAAAATARMLATPRCRRCCWTAASTAGPGPVLLWFHGGGFVFGASTRTGSLAADMAQRLDLPVVLVDYRLAPEAPYPAAVDDAEEIARWLATSPSELGREVTGLVLGGDSAGGTMTIVTAMALRDRPAAAPVVAQMLIVGPPRT